jgi:hypothetical protein
MTGSTERSGKPMPLTTHCSCRVSWALLLQVLGVVENMSTLHVSLDALTFLNTAAGSGSSSSAQADVTAAVTAALQKALVDTGVVPSLSDVSAAADIFLPTGGGAARMCDQLGLHLLGKVPLDPLLGQAAEEGRSVLDADVAHAGPANGTAAVPAKGVAAAGAGPDGRVPPSAAALQAIVQQILQQVEAGADKGQ